MDRPPSRYFCTFLQAVSGRGSRGVRPRLAACQGEADTQGGGTRGDGGVHSQRSARGQEVRSLRRDRAFRNQLSASGLEDTLTEGGGGGVGGARLDGGVARERRAAPAMPAHMGFHHR